MAQCLTIDDIKQTDQIHQQSHHNIAKALEDEYIVHLPNLSFPINGYEEGFFNSQILSGKRKNITYDMARNRLQGDNAYGQQRQYLVSMLYRYALYAHDIIQNACPSYQPHLTLGRTSFRPADCSYRETLSTNQDDSLIHIEAFPSLPTQGKRILRVMTNVDLAFRPREWSVCKDSFKVIASRFALPLVPTPAIVLNCLYRLGVTKLKRTPYDDLMLKLHRKLKQNNDFQENCEQHCLQFWPGSSWIAFTDQIPHGITQGQFCLDQTFYLPVDKQLNPDQSPLRILEGLKDKHLA